ncbi:hypothetical protein GCM10011514_06150 [Emticicia aquatilis]|uniref:Uncharacterized protein n=1 Tax=Emticicia aquatilis TaxID=1537369 RepID=A0A916YHX0_9BACT|nr:hypothetical protein [Emticicia aquatilis]GGD44901.1 hypothetical protein GCM10011514_06150 [Emticicia aquatilis]
MKPPVRPTFPMFFQSPNGYDFWKIESPEFGHFIRNLKRVNNGYCFQSSDVREGEISLILKDEKMIVITETQYLEAVKEQTRRNSVILLKISEKLV